MMNKDKAKGAAIGALATMLLLSATTAFADPVTKQISAVYNDIKLVVNGNSVTPKDSDGNVVEPFIADGTTYVPLRAVGDALGQTVDWDGANKTVYIGKKPDGMGNGLTAIPYARTTVDSPKLTIDGLGNSKEPFYVAGKAIYKGIMINDYFGQGSVFYNTDSKYKKLTGTFGQDDKGKDRGDNYSVLVILGDGKEIYRSSKVFAGDNVDVNVDVTGVNKLELFFDYSKGRFPVFANPQLQ